MTAKQDAAKAAEEQAKQDAAKATKSICGHENMHALNKAGKLAKPKCNKKKGHSGLHGDGKSEWQDEAGKPV